MRGGVSLCLEQLLRHLQQLAFCWDLPCSFRDPLDCHPGVNSVYDLRCIFWIVDDLATPRFLPCR